jgi:hypothetical protein
LLPIRRDTLLERFVDEHESLGVVSGFLRIEGEREGVVTGVGGIRGQCWELGLRT